MLVNKWFIERLRCMCSQQWPTNTGWAKKWPNLFLSELRQIFPKFDSFWHADSQDDTIMWGTLSVHLI